MRSTLPVLGRLRRRWPEELIATAVVKIHQGRSNPNIKNTNRFAKNFYKQDPQREVPQHPEWPVAKEPFHAPSQALYPPAKPKLLTASDMAFADMVLLKYYIFKNSEESVEKIHKILQKGNVDVNKVTENGKYLTQLAIENLDNMDCVAPEILLELLEAGADSNAVNEGGRSLLSLASSAGNLQAMYYLLKNGAEPELKDYKGRAPLIWAANVGDLEAMELLLGVGADINTVDNLGKSALARIIVGGFFARDDRRYHAMNFLLDNGANYDLEFKDAINIGDFKAVKMLLDRGVDLSLPENEYVLHLAATIGNKEIVNILVKNGAASSSLYHGKTPAQIAAQNNYPEIEKILKEVEKKEVNRKGNLDWWSKNGCNLVLGPTIEVEVQRKKPPSTSPEPQDQPKKVDKKSGDKDDKDNKGR